MGTYRGTLWGRGGVGKQMNKNRLSKNELTLSDFFNLGHVFRHAGTYNKAEGSNHFTNSLFNENSKLKEFKSKTILKTLDMYSYM